MLIQAYSPGTLQKKKTRNLLMNIYLKEIWEKTILRDHGSLSPSRQEGL